MKVCHLSKPDHALCVSDIGQTQSISHVLYAARYLTVLLFLLPLADKKNRGFTRALGDLPNMAAKLQFGRVGNKLRKSNLGSTSTHKF